MYLRIIDDPRVGEIIIAIAHIMILSCTNYSLSTVCIIREHLKIDLKHLTLPTSCKVNEYVASSKK